MPTSVYTIGQERVRRTLSNSLAFGLGPSLSVSPGDSAWTANSGTGIFNRTGFHAAKPRHAMKLRDFNDTPTVLVASSETELEGLFIGATDPSYVDDMEDYRLAHIAQIERDRRAGYSSGAESRCALMSAFKAAAFLSSRSRCNTPNCPNCRGDSTRSTYVDIARFLHANDVPGFEFANDKSNNDQEINKAASDRINHIQRKLKGRSGSGVLESFPVRDCTAWGVDRNSTPCSHFQNQPEEFEDDSLSVIPDRIGAIRQSILTAAWVFMENYGSKNLCLTGDPPIWTQVKVWPADSIRLI